MLKKQSEAKAKGLNQMTLKTSKHRHLIPLGSILHLNPHTLYSLSFGGIIPEGG